MSLVVTIWFVKEGEIQVGSPIAEKPLDWCVETLGLRQDNWIAPLERKNLTIGEKKVLGEYGPFRFVVIEITEDDLRAISDKAWQPGFYLLDMDVVEVKRILER